MGQTASAQTQQAVIAHSNRSSQQLTRPMLASFQGTTLKPAASSNTVEHDKDGSYGLPVSDLSSLRQSGSNIALTDWNHSSGLCLGKFNPRAVHRRDLPHVSLKRPSSVSDQAGRPQKKRYCPVKVFPAQEIQPNRQLSPEKKLPVSPVSWGPKLIDTREFRSQQRHDVDIAIPNAQPNVGLLELRHRTTNKSQRPRYISTDSSPVLGPSSFFKSFIPKDPPYKNEVEDLDLKGEDADAKPSIESFMSEMGLLHPLRTYPRTSVKRLPRENPEALKSESSTEEGDEGEEKMATKTDEIDEEGEEVEDAVGNDDDVDGDTDNGDSEPEPHYEYFVVHRSWLHEDGEENARESTSRALTSSADANTMAGVDLLDPPHGHDLQQLYRGGITSMTCSIEDGLSRWEVRLGGGVISTQVERVEKTQGRQIPPEASWIPREAYVVHCTITRIEFPPQHPLQSQGTGPVTSEVTQRPSQIFTTFLRANNAAGGLWFQMRTETLGIGSETESVQKAIILSELSADLRQMNREKEMFDRTWTHGGSTVRIWVECCAVEGPRN